MNFENELNPDDHSDDLMEEVDAEEQEDVEQVEDGAPRAAVVAEGASPRRYVRESAYGERIRLLFAMALLGGLAGCVFGVMVNSELRHAIIDSSILRIIMDLATEPIYDDTPFLFSFGADLAAEVFDKGVHVPVEFLKTDVLLPTDYAKNPSIGVGLQASVKVEHIKMAAKHGPSAGWKYHDAEEFGDNVEQENFVKKEEENFFNLIIDFKKLRVAMKHPHLEQFELIERTRRKAEYIDFMRAPVEDVMDPLTGKVIIRNVADADWEPGRVKTMNDRFTSDEEGSGDESDSDSEIRDNSTNLTLYNTRYFNIDNSKDHKELVETARNALKICVLRGNDYELALERKRNIQNLLSLHSFLQEERECFDMFYTDFYELMRTRANMTGMDDGVAINRTNLAALRLLWAKKNKRGDLKTEQESLREQIRHTSAVLSATSEERCPRCGDPNIVQGGAHGHLCPRCVRELKDEEPGLRKAALRKAESQKRALAKWIKRAQQKEAELLASRPKACLIQDTCVHDDAGVESGGERCPQCGKIILGEGGMPGDVCMSCWRRNRDETLKRKREEDEGDAGGAGGVGV